jgi:hypothetical protein
MNEFRNVGAYFIGITMLLIAAIKTNNYLMNRFDISLAIVLSLLLLKAISNPNTNESGK